MSGNQPAHPARDTLAAYGLGKLQGAEAEAIESHITECEECCETLLDLGSDTFVELVGRSDAVQLDAVDEETTGLRETRGETVCELPEELLQHPRYRVLELLGKGGMGNVYKAEHTLMNREVALKVINQELVQNKQAVERFRREVQSAARLVHPNIVTAFDAEQAGDVHYLVMEYVPGDNMSDVVKRDGPLDIPRACAYIRQAALGLQHAHEKGMVHRDVKPHNLMVTSDGRVKILDFGLATLTAGALPNEEENEASLRDTEHGGSPTLTSAGSMMGTPDFISPEQASDARAADIRSDIYSLGCTFYYLLTGRPPFVEGSAMERAKAHEDAEPEAIENVRVDIPEEVADVVRRMMAKEPAERFQTPAEVADALAPFVDAYRTTKVPTRKSNSPPSTAESGRSWWPPTLVQSLVCAAFAIVLAGVIYVATDNGILKVVADDESVEIIVRGSDGLRIVDTLTGSTAKRLRSGEYLVDLKGDTNDFELDKGRFVLKRGERVIVRVVPTNSSDAADEQTNIVAKMKGPTIEMLSREGTVSPDLKKAVIYGQAAPDGNASPRRLFVNELSSGKMLPIAERFEDGQPSNEDVVWSHDSKGIAYVVFVDEDPYQSEIRIASARDGSVKKVHQSNYWLKIQDCSPNGKSILCVAKNKDNTSSLVTISTESGDSRQLASFGWEPVGHARFSPDGNQIAFHKGEFPNESRVHVVDDAATRVTRLTESRENESNPIWSGNGGHVIYTSGDKLRAVAIDKGSASGASVVLRAGWRDMGKRLSATGGLMFRSVHQTFGLYTSNVSEEGVSLPERIGEISGVAPAWSPDGERLAFLDEGIVKILSLKDRKTESIESGYTAFVFWSPDGTMLAVGPGYPNRRILTYSLDSQKKKTFLRLSKSIPSYVSPKGFSADGQQFVLYSFVAEGDTHKKNVAYDFRTGEEHRIEFTGSDDQIYHYDISPDGKWIAYVTNEPDSNVWKLIVSDVGFQTKKIIAQEDDGKPSTFTSPRWSPDGDRFLYLARIGKHQQICLSTPDRKWKHTVEMGELNHWWRPGNVPSWSPDGSQLAYSLRDGPYWETRVLENFLPPPPEKDTNHVNLEQVQRSMLTPTERRIWVSKQLLGARSISSNKQLLPFVDLHEGNIELRNLATESNRPIAECVTRDGRRGGRYARSEAPPVLSPDGKHVAFNWFEHPKGEEGSYRLRVSSLENREFRDLYHNDEVLWVAPTDWSPDGRSILALLLRKDKTRQIALVSAADGSARIVKSFDWNGPKNLQFAPDGQSILYHRNVQRDRNQPENHDIFLLNVEQNTEFPLVEHPANDLLFGSAPDGRTVLFASDRQGSQDGWAIDASGREEPKLVKKGIGHVDPIGFSGDGSFYYSTSPPTDDVFVATIDEQSRRVVLPPKKFSRLREGGNRSPDWSPDGRKLAYTRPYDRVSITIVDIETEEYRELPLDLAYIERERNNRRVNGDF